MHARTYSTGAPRDSSRGLAERFVGSDRSPAALSGCMHLRRSSQQVRGARAGRRTRIVEAGGTDVRRHPSVQTDPTAAFRSASDRAGRSGSARRSLRPAMMAATAAQVLRTSVLLGDLLPCQHRLWCRQQARLLGRVLRRQIRSDTATAVAVRRFRCERAVGVPPRHRVWLWHRPARGVLCRLRHDVTGVNASEQAVAHCRTLTEHLARCCVAVHSLTPSPTKRSEGFSILPRV